MIISRIPIKMWEFLSALTGSSERDFEDERKRSVLAFFMIIGITITFPFAIYHFTLGNLIRAILLLFVGSIQLASLVALHFLRRANVVFRLNVILLGSYFLFLIVVDLSNLCIFPARQERRAFLEYSFYTSLFGFVHYASEFFSGISL